MGWMIVIDADVRARRGLEDALRRTGRASQIEAFEDLNAANSALRRPDIDLLFFGVGPGATQIDPAWPILGGCSGRIVWTGPLREAVEPALAAGMGLDFLVCPPKLPALSALLARHLGTPALDDRALHDLDRIAGDPLRFPPAEVAFLVHRQNATGWLEVEAAPQAWQVGFQNGKITACKGITDLLAELSVEIPPESDLMGAVGFAVGRGIAPDRAMEVLSIGIGRRLLAKDCKDVRFRRVDAIPGMALPLSVPRLLAKAIDADRAGITLRESLRSAGGIRIRVRIPEGGNESTWGLPAVGMRLLREARKVATLDDLIAAAGGDREELWSALAHLLSLGLLAIGEPLGEGGLDDLGGDITIESIVIEPIHGYTPGPSPIFHPPIKPHSVQAPPPAPSPVMEATGVDSLSRVPATPTRPKNQPATSDPRLAELQQQFSILQAQQPWELLELEQAADIHIDELDKRFRTLSARFHPDTFAGAPRAVQEAAGECFALVQAARSAFDEEAFRKETRERLLAKAAGRVFVSDSDRKAAKFAFKQGEVAHKQRRYAEASAHFQRASELDPTDWAPAFYTIEAAWRAGQINPKEAAARVLTIRSDRKSENAEILFSAGEMALAGGDEKQAYGHFQAALEKDPNHTGALRRVRLKNRREEKVEEEKQTTGIMGFFRGLTNRGATTEEPKRPPTGGKKGT
jgi:hypothetical protein